jgi:hypothetical protein
MCVPVDQLNNTVRNAQMTTLQPLIRVHRRLTQVDVSSLMFILAASKRLFTLFASTNSSIVIPPWIPVASGTWDWMIVRSTIPQGPGRWDRLRPLPGLAASCACPLPTRENPLPTYLNGKRRGRSKCIFPSSYDVLLVPVYLDVHSGGR